jgi:osmoprotectant transport system permease protein
VDVAGGAAKLPVFHTSSCITRNGTFCWSWFSSNWGKVLWPALRQHILLTLIGVGVGFIIATGLALWAHRSNWVERPVTIVTAVLYTIPSLALFQVLVTIHQLGFSLLTAEIAIVSYTLLILFRNMLTGLRSVPADVRDAARGMGMTRNQVLRRVEIPMALPAIIAGLRIATVTVISLSTVASIVCNQGLGVPILAAIADNGFKTELIAAGGMAVLLALFADGALVILQRLMTPWTRRTA